MKHILHLLDFSTHIAEMDEAPAMTFVPGWHEGTGTIFHLVESDADGAHYFEISEIDESEKSIQQRWSEYKEFSGLKM